MSKSTLLNNLQKANPNIVRQIADWQTQRIERNEDPFDWDAFCNRLTLGLGAPYPGSKPPTEFTKNSLSL